MSHSDNCSGDPQTQSQAVLGPLPFWLKDLYVPAGSAVYIVCTQRCRLTGKMRHLGKMVTWTNGAATTGTGKMRHLWQIGQIPKMRQMRQMQIPEMRQMRQMHKVAIMCCR